MICLAQIVMLEQRGNTEKYAETGLNFSQLIQLTLIFTYHIHPWQNGIILHCMLHKIYLLDEKYMTCLEIIYKFCLTNVKYFCLCSQSGTFTHKSRW